MPPKPPKIDADRLAMHSDQVVKNPAFIAAFDAIKENYTEQWRATKPEESEKREHLHKCIHALEDVRTALTIFVSTGKMEKMMELKRAKAKK